MNSTPLLNNKQDKSIELEHYRLAGRPPLKTIMFLSIGPMVSQVVGALYSIIDTIWVAKACGDEGMAAVSTYNCFDNIGRSFGFFICTAAATKTAQLFGQRKEPEVNQIFCDLIRCALICGMIVPAILLPTVKHAARWFGANEDIVQFGYEYISFLSGGSFCTCLFLTCGGFLQGEGRTHVFAAMELFSFILNGFLFDPLLLLVGKLGVRGAAIATVLSELFPSLILIGWYFKGAFAVRPELRGLFRKFSPHTFQALRVGFAQLITNLSYFVPTIIVRKLLGLTLPPDQFNEGFAGYNVCIRFQYLTDSVFNAINQAVIPAASYAHGAERHARWLKLIGHACWINFCWGLTTASLTWTIPRQLSMMFSKSEGYLRWAGPMMRFRNALGFFAFGRFNCQTILQSFQKGGLATILSILSQFFAITGFSFLMYYIKKDDAVHLMWCYPLTDTFGLICGLCFCSTTLYQAFKMAKTEPREGGREASSSTSNQPDHLMV